MRQPILYTYTVTNTSSPDPGAGDLALAASTADTDAFIDERNSLNIDGTQSLDNTGLGEVQEFAISNDADTGETTASGVGTGRIYTITIKALDPAGVGTDDLDFAATTADADAFIDERYSLNFDDASESAGRDLLIGGAGHLDAEPYNGDGAVNTDYVMWRRNDSTDTDAQTFDYQSLAGQTGYTEPEFFLI
jgi:hypothetical protein